MHYLYGSRPEMPRRLVATFDSEQQLTAYVRWATLSEHDGARKFEKGSSLAGYQGYSLCQRTSHERRRRDGRSQPVAEHAVSGLFTRARGSPGSPAACRASNPPSKA